MLPERCRAMFSASHSRACAPPAPAPAPGMPAPLPSPICAIMFAMLFCTGWPLASSSPFCCALACSSATFAFAARMYSGSLSISCALAATSGSCSDAIT